MLSAAATDEAPPPPLLERIEIVTIGADNIAAFTADYERWFEYTVAETGRISAALAASWGTPATAGRAYALLHSRGAEDVWLRVVDVDVPEAHKAMTTLGWSVVEFLVENPDAIYAHLSQSSFRHIGGPANLGGGASSIRATQFIGPAAVAVYLTADTAPPDSALLPRAKSFIDRPFIVVLATDDAVATDRFYRSRFRLGGYPPRPVNVGVVAAALGLPSDHTMPLGLAAAAQQGNFIEIDGYPRTATPRPRAAGQLPPGVAMVSFSVGNLDALNVPYLAPPRANYRGRRAAAFIGPAGELTELIEAKRPQAP